MAGRQCVRARQLDESSPGGSAAPSNGKGGPSRRGDNCNEEPSRLTFSLRSVLGRSNWGADHRVLRGLAQVNYQGLRCGDSALGPAESDFQHEHRTGGSPRFESRQQLWAADGARSVSMLATACATGLRPAAPDHRGLRMIARWALLARRACLMSWRATPGNQRDVPMSSTSPSRSRRARRQPRSVAPRASLTQSTPIAETRFSRAAITSYERCLRSSSTRSERAFFGRAVSESAALVSGSSDAETTTSATCLDGRSVRARGARNPRVWT